MVHREPFVFFRRDGIMLDRKINQDSLPCFYFGFDFARRAVSIPLDLFYLHGFGFGVCLPWARPHRSPYSIFMCNKVLIGHKWLRSWITVYLTASPTTINRRSIREWTFGMFSHRVFDLNTEMDNGELCSHPVFIWHSMSAVQ